MFLIWHMKKLIGLFFVVVLYFACTDCEDDSEPVAKVYFMSGKNDYECIMGLNADGIKDSVYAKRQYPLSIASDTTIYVFYGTETNDTMAISYLRNFSFESSECGFTVTLSDFENLEMTTFDSVLFNIKETSRNLLLEKKQNAYIIEIYH